MVTAAARYGGARARTRERGGVRSSRAGSRVREERPSARRRRRAGVAPDALVGSAGGARRGDASRSRRERASPPRGETRSFRRGVHGGRFGFPGDEGAGCDGSSFGFASRDHTASRPSASSRRASVARASTRSRASARAWGPSSRRARRPGGTPRAKKTALKTTEKRRLNPARRSRLSPIPTPTRIRWSPSLGAVRSPSGPPSPPTPTRGFARRRRAASTWSSERRGSFATRRGRRDRSTARTTLRRTTPLWTTTLWTTTLWTRADDACSAASEKSRTDGRNKRARRRLRMDSRERVVEATGDLDVAALIASARRSFRRAPPPARRARGEPVPRARGRRRRGTRRLLELRVWYSERRATNGGGISRRGADDDYGSSRDVVVVVRGVSPASFALRLNAPLTPASTPPRRGHINPASASAGGRKPRGVLRPPRNSPRGRLGGARPRRPRGAGSVLRGEGSEPIERRPSRVDVAPEGPRRGGAVRSRPAAAGRVDAGRRAVDRVGRDGVRRPPGARGGGAAVGGGAERGARGQRARGRDDRQPVAVVKDERYERRRYSLV